MKKGWRETNLADVCDISSVLVDPREAQFQEMIHVGGANIEASTGVLLDLKTAKEEGLKSGKFVFDETMVLYSKIRPYLMKVVRPEFRGLCSADIYPLSPDPDRLDRGYLYHQLFHSRFTEFAVSGSARAGMPKVNREHLFAFQFWLPPLPEQQRIVGILDEAFEGIATAKANAEKNLQNARALFDSHLQSVFTQRGEGWVETTLGAEIDLLAGFAFKSAQYVNGSDDVRLLRGDNIVQGSLRWEDVKKWPAHDVAGYERYELRAGDVVLAMDRPWVKAGLKHATIGADDLPCLLVQRTARLRGGEHLDNSFLKLLIGSEGFTRHILGVQTGIGVPHISVQQIKDFEFSRPPKPEQRRIAKNLESIRAETQRLATLYTRKLAALEALKKSLLDQAFRGEL